MTLLDLLLAAALAAVGASDPPPPPTPPIAYKDSRAVGEPGAGRLLRGVRLPEGGPGFETWDPIMRTRPNRPWRRNGTDGTVRAVLRVAARYRRLEPGARPMLVGDLSRTRGGDFGVKYGIVGHSTHQNGLNVDVYYPRRDRRRKPPRTVRQVDLRRAQLLVDLWLEAGAKTVLVGPRTPLKGPRGVVKPYPNHDNHLHVVMPKRG